MLTDDQGREHGPYDLVVAADGARSVLRAALPVRRDRAYRWGALWTILPDPDGRCTGVLDQFFDGTHRLLGLLPPGVPPHLGTRTVSLFWSVRADRLPAVRAAGLDGAEGARCARWRRAPRRCSTGWSPSTARPAVYRDVRLARWHADGLAVVGDAGHAMSPQLGQGANLALMDAAALADAPPHALAAYTPRAPAAPALLHARLVGAQRRLPARRRGDGVAARPADRPGVARPAAAAADAGHAGRPRRPLLDDAPRR